MIRLKTIKASDAVVIVTLFVLPFITRNTVAVLIPICFLSSNKVIITTNMTLRIERKWVMLYIYIFSYIISGVFAKEIILTIRETLILVLVITWFFTIYAKCKQNKEMASLLIKTYCFSCIVLSILYLLYKGIGIGQFKWVASLELAITDNHFCYYIGGAFIIGFVSSIYEKNYSRLLFYIPILVDINLATGRGAIAAITISCLIAYLQLSNETLIRKAIIAIIITILLFSYQYFSSYITDIRRVFDPTSTFSNRERYALWSTCLKMIKDRPYGVGAGNWASIYNQLYRTTVNTYPHAHNAYLQIACELGILGLVAFVGILISSYKEVKNAYIKDSSPYYYAISIFVIYSMLYFIFNNPINNNKPLLLLFFAIGVCYASKCDSNTIH